MKHTHPAIDEAVRVLRTGGVIAYPTETVYGFGCDPRDAKAVKRIFALKGRPENKPTLLIVGSMLQLNKVADLSKLSPAARKTFSYLAKTYWPGALTMVLPAKKGAGLSRLIVPKNEVAVRLSSSPVAMLLAQGLKFPIVSTSANKAGKDACRSVTAIIKAFPADKLTPDLIMDGGSIARRKPSTMVRILPTGKLEILRQGAIKPTLSA